MTSSATADIIENNYSSDTAVTNRNDGYSSDYDADDESDQYSPQSPQRVVRRTRSSNNKPFKAAKGKKTSSSIWINLEDEDTDTTGPTPMTERVNQKEHKEMGRLGKRKRSQDEATDNSSHSSTEKRSICSSKTSKTEPMDNETMTTTWRPEDERLGAVLTCSSVQLRKIIQILCHLRDMCSGSCDDDASKIEYQTEIQRIIDFLNIRAAGNNVGARAGRYNYIGDAPNHTDHLKQIMVILKETDPQKRLADLFNYELYLKRQKALQVKGMGGC